MEAWTGNLWKFRPVGLHCIQHRLGEDWSPHRAWATCICTHYLVGTGPSTLHNQYQGHTTQPWLHQNSTRLPRPSHLLDHPVPAQNSPCTSLHQLGQERLTWFVLQHWRVDTSTCISTACLTLVWKCLTALSWQHRANSSSLCQI